MNTPPEIPRTTPPKTSGLAIASLVFGIISVIGGLLLIIPPILAIIFGVIALTKFKSDPTLKGKGLAIAGLVTTGVSILMIPVIGLLAAMAIPAFQKVRETSLEKMMMNDARQIGAAAQIEFLDHPQKTIIFNIDSQTGAVSGPLAKHVATLGKGTVVEDGLLKDETDGFALSHPLLKKGKVYHFDAEGRLLENPAPLQQR